VKTPLLCYDSLVILRGKLMRRFVEQADRGQWTLLPECLDDFIDESIRRNDVSADFRGANNSALASFDGEHDLGKTGNRRLVQLGQS
jgi:hypothetical protein